MELPSNVGPDSPWIAAPTGEPKPFQGAMAAEAPVRAEAVRKNQCIVRFVPGAGTNAPGTPSCSRSQRRVARIRYLVPALSTVRVVHGVRIDTWSRSTASEVAAAAAPAASAVARAMAC